MERCLKRYYILCQTLYVAICCCCCFVVVVVVVVVAFVVVVFGAIQNHFPHSTRYTEVVDSVADADVRVVVFVVVVGVGFVVYGGVVVGVGVVVVFGGVSVSVVVVVDVFPSHLLPPTTLYTAHVGNVPPLGSSCSRWTHH